MADLVEIKAKADAVTDALGKLIGAADDIKAKLDAAIASEDPAMLQAISDELGTAVANAQAEVAKLTT